MLHVNTKHVTFYTSTDQKRLKEQLTGPLLKQKMQIMILKKICTVYKCKCYFLSIFVTFPGDIFVFSPLKWLTFVKHTIMIPRNSQKPACYMDS